MVRILFLAANPRDTNRLRLDEEVRAIDQVLLQGEQREIFDLSQQWAVRVADLQGHLLRHRPDIVHFSGHGSPTSEIVLQDDYGGSHTVSVRALSQLFSILRDNIRCVVLNACYSQTQAEAIAKHIDCVIGMSKAIGDEAAISFATAFYRALGFGRDVQTAFELGCLQIDMQGLPEYDLPKLIAEKANPREICFAPTMVAGGTKPAAGYVIDQRGQHVESQFIVDNLNVASLGALDEIDETTKRKLTTACESLTAECPDRARYQFALGLFYLDRRLYSRAIRSLESAHDKDPLNASILYYLALACLERRELGILRLSTVRRFEDWIRAAIEIDDRQAHYMYLWAMVKYEYYLANGLRDTPPTIEELLGSAQQLPLNHKEAQHMLEHLPEVDNPVVEVVLRRSATSGRRK